jgi:hypothetical protein
LIDSEARHRANPETWDYPEALIARIAPGDWVKVGVETHDPSKGCCGGERFWCQVVRVTAAYIRVEVMQWDMLDADCHGVREGDVLIVERRHILDVRSPELERIA